ncbi:IclR family transcriptional regulator [Ramlibacter sp. AN1133]|uniref:IclR family transcriptional regulator n=1 Tax=Ramlibacter sp. AN1133 TaxID=3133429 RepID=UPI0030C55C4B
MIRAVGRALAIFDAYDNEHLSLSLQEIAERIRMPKTTAFRLVNTLERAGFLVRMDNQQYCLSLKMARLGGLVRSTLSIREIARPVMLQVNEQTRETITLNTIVGVDRMVLEVVDTPAPLMSMARQGQHMPLFLGASSRILLAYMEPDELEKVVKANMKTPDFDRAAFDRELARFRRQGYALTRGQRVSGLTAIAVPIFDMKGAVRHCLALTGPSIRVDSRDQELAEIMMTAGRDISNRLGASPEHGIDMKLLMSDTSTDRDEAPPRKKPAAKKKPPAKKSAATA